MNNNPQDPPTKSEANENTPPTKRPYQAPKLIRLGSLPELTLNTFGGKALDGGPANKHTIGRGGRAGIG